MSTKSVTLLSHAGRKIRESQHHPAQPFWVGMYFTDPTLNQFSAILAQYFLWAIDLKELGIPILCRNPQRYEIKL